MQLGPFRRSLQVSDSEGHPALQGLRGCLLRHWRKIYEQRFIWRPVPERLARIRGFSIILLHCKTEIITLFRTSTLLFLSLQSAPRVITNRKVLGYHSYKIDSKGIRTKRRHLSCLTVYILHCIIYFVNHYFKLKFGKS